jgi:uncharacterized membrane protein YbhN (UPF0104 family)
VGGRLGATVTALGAFALIGVVCVLHAADVGRAIAAVPAWALAAAVALHVTTLVARSEAWRLTLHCAGGPVLPRTTVHLANAAAFVAGTAQSQAALPARVTVLRRLAGDAAPRAGQIYVADVPIFVIELGATALVVIAGVATGRGTWWMAPLAVGVALVAAAAVRWIPRRFAHRPFVRGLAVFAARGRRGRLVVLVAAVVAVTLVRIWLVLAACGLPHTLGEVAWVFAAMGILGLLPLGPGASPGATLVALAGSSVGAATAAGLLLGASSIVAVVMYAVAVACVARLRRPVRRVRAPRAARRLARSSA